VASVQAGTAPVFGLQSLRVQEGRAARQLDGEEIAALINRGTDSLKSGDLISARLLLRRAAEAGSASAALMLGTTFDPLVIQQLGAIGVVPDVAQARQWYEKAAELGSDAASQRLAKLPQTGQ
jgi:TPR repeat protein